MLMCKCRDISNRPINPHNKDAVEMPWNLILGGFWCAKIKTATTHSKEPHLISQPQFNWVSYKIVSCGMSCTELLFFSLLCVQMFTCGRGVSCLACSSLRPRGWRARLWLRGRRRRATMGWATILSLSVREGSQSLMIESGHNRLDYHLVNPHLVPSRSQSHVWSLKVVRMRRSHNRISAEHKEHWLEEVHTTNHSRFKARRRTPWETTLLITASSHVRQRQYKLTYVWNI